MQDSDLRGTLLPMLRHVLQVILSQYLVLGGKSSPRLPVNIITQSVHVAIELIQLHLSCAFNKTLTGTLAFGNYCTTSP